MRQRLPYTRCAPVLPGTIDRSTLLRYNAPIRPCGGGYHARRQIQACHCHPVLTRLTQPREQQARVRHCELNRRTTQTSQRTHHVARHRCRSGNRGGGRAGCRALPLRRGGDHRTARGLIRTRVAPHGRRGRDGRVTGD